MLSPTQATCVGIRACARAALDDSASAVKASPAAKYAHLGFTSPNLLPDALPVTLRRGARCSLLRDDGGDRLGVAIGREAHRARVVGEERGHHHLACAGTEHRADRQLLAGRNERRL